MSRLLLSSLKHSYLKLNYASTLSQNRTFFRSNLPCASCVIAQRNYSRPAVAERTFNNVDAKITRLDQQVKRLGRTILKEVESTLKEIENAGSISVTQSLMMIRSCGSLLVEVKPESRTDLAHRIWKLLRVLGVKLDISHYNALLRVYLENDYDFSPSEILSEIEKIGLEPNRVTCQRLINRYCQMGDIAGATRILQFMREKGMPINESVFNALISGHSGVNDMESAEGILTVMKEGGIDPSSETYTLLMCGYIKNGNLAKVEELFKQCEAMEIIFTDKDYFDIIYAYTMHGYENEVEKLLDKINKSATYNHDAMNFTFKLLTAGKPETAYKILKSMLRSSRPDGSILPLGNFFIAHLVRNNAPVDLIIKYCRDLMNENLNPRALSIALENALRCGKEDVALSLFREAKKSDLLPIRHHYFWPLLVNRGRKNDISGLCDILHKMNQEFGLLPNGETLREYVIPYMLMNEHDIGKILLDLRSCGVTVASGAGNMVHYLVDRGDMERAVEVAEGFDVHFNARIFRNSLIHGFFNTHDTKSFVALLRELSSDIHRHNNRETENEVEVQRMDHREFTGEIVQQVVDRLLSKGKKEIVEDLLKKLMEAEIGISENRVNAIQALVKDALPSGLVSSLEKLSSEDLATPAVKTKPSKFSLSSLDHDALERLYEANKAKGITSSLMIKRLLFISYSKNHNVEKMKQLKEELEAAGFHPNTTMEVYELDAYVATNKLEEAVQLYDKLASKDPNFVLNPTKTLNLIALLVEHEQYDKAREILNKRIEVSLADEQASKEHGVMYHRNNTVHKILNTLADKGQFDKVKEFLDLIIASKIVEPSVHVLSPLIRAHIKRDDYEGAMKEFENCVRTYKLTPMRSELALHFIEKEDSTNLQKLTDLCTEVHGEMNSLVDLMFVFLESGRLKQAKKILETPGLRLRPDRLAHMAELLVEKGCVENIINLLKLAKGIPFIDRAVIYEKLLSLYVKSNDTENSLSLWMEIQEEDLQPSDTFLITLSDLLKSNNIEVPFIVPEVTVIETISTKKPVILRTNGGRKRTSTENSKFNKLIQSGDLDGAVTLVKSGKPVEKNEFSQLVDRLLQNNRYPEAKECLLIGLKKNNLVVYRNIFSLFLRQAAENADLDLFAELNTRLLKDEFKSKVGLYFWSAMAYEKAGRLEEYISSWEHGLEKIKTKQELENFLAGYPRSYIIRLMDENPEYIPRVEAFAQKCVDIDRKQGNVYNVLFDFYMIRKDYEKAKEIWENYIKNASRLYSRNILMKVTNNLDTELGSKFLSFVKDHPQGERILHSVYNVLIKAHVQKNEVEEAKQCLQDALKRMPIETLKIRVLESLKSACLDKGIDFPYDITDKRTRKEVKEGSDSDSDSD